MRTASAGVAQNVGGLDEFVGLLADASLPYVYQGSAMMMFDNPILPDSAQSIVCGLFAMMMTVQWSLFMLSRRRARRERADRLAREHR